MNLQRISTLLSKTLISVEILVLILAAAAAWPAAGTEFSLTAEWGEYGVLNGQFKYPCMVAVDGPGHVYVVDQHNHRMQKFSADGKFLQSWGSFGDGHGQFNYPFGIAVDSNGAVYVSDMDNHRVQKFSTRGEFRKMTGGYGTENGRFKHPYGIAIDKNGVIYVIDTLNYRVQEFDRDLNFLGAWGSQEAFGIRIYMPTTSLSPATATYS
jgi:DNA-binding beta-propeller fold protein YncE